MILATVFTRFIDSPTSGEIAIAKTDIQSEGLPKRTGMLKKAGEFNKVVAFSIFFKIFFSIYQYSLAKSSIIINRYNS